MADQYVGEIRYFTYMRGAPEGWLACDGSTPSISQYEALATLLGTTYGGDGQSTFGLPDLRGRVAIGSAGSSYGLGSTTGSETVTLNSTQLPAHNHAVQGSTTTVSGTDPTNQTFGTGANVYFAPTGTPAPVAMAGNATGSTGQGLPHENCAPTLPLLACIAWDGVWPSRND